MPVITLGSYWVFHDSGCKEVKMSECLGIRGATTADSNSEDAILDATEDLSLIHI